MGLLSVAHSRHAELMDDPGLPEAEHLHALRALRTINLFSRTAAQLTAAAVALIPHDRPGPIEIVDVACGGGDVTRACGRGLARRLAGRDVTVTGIDFSSRAIEQASQASDAERSHAASCRIRFLQRDVVAEGCPPCDVAISSLFLHHLDDDAAQRVLRSLAAACRLGFVISDLIRSPLGLALAVAGTNVLSTSRVARVDGPLSVRAARTATEYRTLLNAAGLPEATIRRTWPERILITWRRRPPA